MRDKLAVSAYGKKYRASKPDFIRKLQAEYYYKHREERIKNARKWTLNNKEQSLETRRSYMRTPKGRLTSVKGSAKTRGIAYEISDTFALSLLEKNCYFCLEEGQVGIDRLDSNLGYIEGNCVPCCKMCNYMKGTYTKEQFIEKCNKISKAHIVC